MPSTHLSLHYHVVFSTKDRVPSIAAAWRERLHAYLGGVVRNVNGVPEAIGGIADHVHLLIGLRATACLADVVRDVKAVSSRWVHEEIGEHSFAWQGGIRRVHGQRVATGYCLRIHRAAGGASSKADISGGIQGTLDAQRCGLRRAVSLVRA